ncbi:MAG: fused MFS/spermidine synthase [Deltaproteobacteria bacterium]|nr:fused MFS/spermidine synthase [Deltaproteobacteria bacterium]
MAIVYVTIMGMLVLFGAAVMSLEILASNLMSPYFGGSIYIWGSIISSFMIHFSVGYVLGGYLCKKTEKVYPLILLLIIASLWVMFIPVIHPPAGEFVSTRIADVRYGSLVAMNVIFFLPVTIMAMVSPYIIGILSLHQKTSGLSAGLVLFISTLGSFLGTNATAFYLINLFPVSVIVRGIGAACLVFSVLTLSLRLDKRLRF